MAATSLKMPDELKRRIDALAAAAKQSPHAFMVDTLAREAQRLELQLRFAADAATSESQALRTGKSIPVKAAFDYLEARLAGRPARRPRARSWRTSR